MKISEFKNHLSTISEVIFSLPDGSNVSSHYHITEVGFITKTYIDCGGTVREEKVANFQLWTAEDFDHRIQSEKILEIISKAEEEINLEDLEIEVEYQNETIGKYNLEFYDNKFHLSVTQTDCLAKEKNAESLVITFLKHYPVATQILDAVNPAYILYFLRLRKIDIRRLSDKAKASNPPNIIIVSDSFYSNC